MADKPVLLDHIFHPRSVAVHGASGGLENVGARFLSILKRGGFKGPLYAVNPQGTPARKYETFKSLMDIPGPVDLVHVAVPAPAVPDVIRQCVAKKVRIVTIFTSGFREIGTPQGAALEKEIAAIAQDGGVRLIGPNCMGIYCPETGLSFRIDFPNVDGPVSFVSQSGGVAISGVLSANERGIGFAKVVSYGNECDLTSTELVSYLRHDPRTEIIMAYIEGSREPKALLDAIKQAAAQKPVVVLKGGTSAEGSRAVASHTGALTGAHTAWDAALKQANAVSASGMDEFIDIALTFLRVPPPKDRRLGIVSISGGMCVLLTDLATRLGFQVPVLSEKTMEGLRQFFAGQGTSVKNPLDLAMTFFFPENFSLLLSLLDEDERIDAILFHISMEYLTLVSDRRPEYLDIMAKAIAAAAGNVKKPIILVVAYTTRDEVRVKFIKPLVQAGLAVYPDVERALKAYNHVIRYHEIRKRRQASD